MEIPNSYLFTAYYDEGDGNVTLYRQDAGDRSIQKPDEKNAYYDISYEPFKPVEQLYAFRLEAVEGAVVPEGTPRTIGVNLRTGQFEADDRLFLLHDHLADDYDTIGPMRLMYFRNAAQHRQETRNIKTGKTKVKVGYTLGYILGWQATAEKDGKEKNLTKFISISGVPTLLGAVEDSNQT